jgi:hypothetical protein
MTRPEFVPVVFWFVVVEFVVVVVDEELSSPLPPNKPEKKLILFPHFTEYPVSNKAKRGIGYNAEKARACID